MDFWNWIVKTLKDYFGLNNLGNPQGWLNLVFGIITLTMGVLLFYRFIYTIMGLFGKSRTYEKKPEDYRYCFILSARNEEKVIGNLIDSIHEQTYPQKLIDIIVLADNCSDQTAAVAKAHGATLVYERHDPSKARKGWALEFLFGELAKKFDLTKEYNGYVFMDSDNVLAPDFLEKINDPFHLDYDVVSGYRNVKNMKENWISAISGLNWHRAVLYSQRPRSMINSAEQISGTGFVMKSALLKDGWHFTCLTEDGEATTRLVAQGKKLGYCEAAAIYDEQPTSLKIALRQRLRWAKGGIVNFLQNDTRLFVSFFKKPSFSKYDIFWEMFPYALVSFLAGVIFDILGIVFCFVYTGPYDWGNFATNKLVNLAVTYASGYLVGWLIIIREWKHIHLNFGEALLYSFLWPFFDMVGVPIALWSLFVKVSWKPIPHHAIVEGSALQAEEQAKQKKK